MDVPLITKEYKLVPAKMTVWSWKGKTAWK